MLPGTPQAPPSLPELRQDLTIEQGAVGASGEATWLIVDAAQHRYVQIDEATYQMLSCWTAGAPYAVFAASVSRRFHVPVTEDDANRLVRFVAANNLTVEPLQGGWQHYATTAQEAEHGWLMWMVHNYLYIKLPLLQPEPALRKLLPWVAPLYTRTFFYIVAAIGLTGLYLVSRHWAEFWATFQHSFSLEGAAIFGIALIVVKSAHELGHAFTALRFGCRVPSMGVCFLVMFPVLYTDVSDAWRLQDRRHRLMIGGAGVAVELALACLATFLWVFLPEGIAKSLAFSIATTGWILSLMINLNPLMRFDGYYLFSDWLGVDNLQSRAFAFGRWRLKEFLFGAELAAPERMPAAKIKALIGYAWVVWIYRVILFTGIALLVYHMTFKVLGIILFLVEIIYFILWPIVSELGEWWAERKTLAVTRRAKITGFATALGLLAAFVPWSTQVAVPAVLEASELSRVFPERPGVVVDVRVKAGDTVKAGDVLVVMRSAESEHRLQLIKKNIALTKMRLARRASDGEDRAQSLVLEKQLQSLMSEFSGLNKELAEYVLTAPRAGVIAEFNGEVHKGRAIGRHEHIALIKAGSTLTVRGYVGEDQLHRLTAKATGTFLPELPSLERVSVTLRDIATSGAASIETPELASLYGGGIAVRPHNGDRNEKRMIPVTAHYLTTLDVASGTPPPPFSVRGVVELKGEAQSLAMRAWRQIAAVLVRESGF